MFCVRWRHTGCQLACLSSAMRALVISQYRSTPTRHRWESSLYRNGLQTSTQQTNSFSVPIATWSIFRRWFDQSARRQSDMVSYLRAFFRCSMKRLVWQVCTAAFSYTLCSKKHPQLPFCSVSSRMILFLLWNAPLGVRGAKPVMLSPHCQSNLEAKVMSSASKIWPRPLPRSFGLGIKHLAFAWPRSRCLIM